MNVESTDASGTEAMNAALAGIGEEPMPAESQTTEAAPVPATQEWKGDDWKFSWNGKDIIPDSRDKLMTWANQGYNYSQRMGELNKTHAQRMAEVQAAEAKARELEQKYAQYDTVEQYAQKNPEWWQHVQQSFANREIPQGLDPNLAKVLTPLQQEIGQIKEFMTTQQQLAEQARVAAEHQSQDQALDAEIESFRKSFPNIDLSARDESGKTLEHRIYEHGTSIGTSSFRAAARDLLFDQLANQNGAQTRLQAVQTQQAKAKAGLLGTTQAPTKELKRVDTKLPWSDPAYSDMGAILQEFRQTQGG